MTPFEKFKKHAETVLFWIEDEKPRVRRFGCENCNHRRYHCDSDFGVATQSYQVTIIPSMLLPAMLVYSYCKIRFLPKRRLS